MPSSCPNHLLTPFLFLPGRALQVQVAWVLWGRGLAPEGTAWGGVWWTPSLEAGCPLGPGLPGTLPLLMPCASPFWLLPPC